MRRVLKALGSLALFLLAGLCFAPTVIPPFLDRIYHRGPDSDHFDGARFFNPGHAGYAGGNPARFFNRWIGGERAEWPDHVMVPEWRPSPLERICRLYEQNPDDYRAGMYCGVGQHTDLMFATWVGHSTVLIQAYGLNILTDPIWSERASPFSFIGPKRVRRPGIPFEELPHIDLVLVSHNHYDHMDLPTLRRLWERDRPLIVTSLGNEAILREAGIESRALDWGQTLSEWRICAMAFDPCPAPEIKVTLNRNHHWSSRWGTDRNRALWSAFTVHLPGGNIFFAGDTGWGDGGWADEAARHGPYRLAIIPIGAYEPRDFMKTHHINPEEAVSLFEALQPRMALGVHWGTFQLTFEAINDPPRRLAELRRRRGIAPNAFVATEVGQSFYVPPIR